MEPSGDAVAPELDLDDKSQYGFVQWYNALPQVSWRSAGMQPVTSSTGLGQLTLMCGSDRAGQSRSKIF